MKKQLLTLLPLVLMLTSCGKDVDPKVNKVDLSRLLSQDEISSAFKTIADNFSNNLVGMEVNLSTLEDNLIDQKNENSAGLSGETRTASPVTTRESMYSSVSLYQA